MINVTRTGADLAVLDRAAAAYREAVRAGEGGMMRWPAGARLREARMPVVTVGAVRFGDMLAEVRYPGAAGSHLVPSVRLAADMAS